MQNYTLEHREGVNLTSTKMELEKAKEAELESSLDGKTPYLDDSHIYDEPLQCLEGRAPLPLPPNYKNVRTLPDVPPSYSSTVRFLQSAPLANSPMSDSFLFNGMTSGQHETSDYSGLDTSAIPRLEYGNIGQCSGDSALSEQCTTGYSYVVSQATRPNTYAEMPVVTSSPEPSHNQPSCSTNIDLSTKDGHPQTYETPAKKQSDYQPLLSGERLPSGEYTQALQSPDHVHSGEYDVPRGQSGEPAFLHVTEDETSAPSTVPEVGDDKKEYVNIATQESDDLLDYVEMASAFKQEQCSP